MTGFVQFDPDKWDPESETPPPANVAKVAKDAASEGEGLATLAALAGVQAAGVRKLDAVRVPRGVRPEPWACAVRDATALIDDGWSDAALAQGWSALDLFGAVTDPEGDPMGDGLAVWMAGRRVVVLDEARAIARDAKGGRHYFERPSLRVTDPSTRLLWTLGGGR